MYEGVRGCKGWALLGALRLQRALGLVLRGLALLAAHELHALRRAVRLAQLRLAQPHLVT